MTSGYFRFPTIHLDTIVFASEDDLWTVPADGGVARRLTSGLADATRPSLSPDGTLAQFRGPRGRASGDLPDAGRRWSGTTGNLSG